jgi:enoyl-CoA hydratase/carnithine racemase
MHLLVRWVRLPGSMVWFMILNFRPFLLIEPLGDEFVRVIEEIKQTEGVRCVVLTGAGRAFSAGGDLEFLKARYDQ